MVASKEYSTIVGPDPELVYGFFDPNTALIAATTFGKKVNWIAVGTPAEA